MTLTRIPACTIRGCPAPRDPDWHKPWCSTIEGHGCFGDATHQHWPKRSQGGKEIVACLCAGAHDRIDNGDWGNAVFETVEDGKRIRIYRAWDLHDKTLIEQIIGIGEGDGCNSGDTARVASRPAGAGRDDASHLEAGSAAAEGMDSTARNTPDEASACSVSATEPAGGGGSSAAASPASGESSAAEPPVRGALPGPAGDSRLVPSPSAAPPSVFDLSSWCAEGMQLVYFGIALRDGQDEVRFRIGDWYNRGEGILGEETVGYLRGFEDVTVRQYSWVAGCVAPDTRVLELPWSYHRLVAALPAPKQKEWLDKARDENLTTRQLHQAIHGKKPKVKRWTLEELRELAKEHWELVRSGPNAREAEGGEQFLDWLEAK